MTPDQATTILQSVGLPSLNAEHPVTRRVIAAIPDDKVDYRPDEIVKSAIDLAWHIVTAEVRFMNAVSAGTFDLTPHSASRHRSHRRRCESLARRAVRESVRSVEADVRRSVDQGRRFPRPVPVSRRRICAARAEPLHPSPRATLDVLCGRWARRCRRSTARATTHASRGKPRRRRRSRFARCHHPQIAEEALGAGANPQPDPPAAGGSLRSFTIRTGCGARLT